MLRILRLIYHSERLPLHVKSTILLIYKIYKKYRYNVKVRYNFPWNANGAELLIGHPLFLDRDNFAYYAQFYSQFYIPSNKDIVGNYQYKVEMYRAKFLTKDSEVCIYFNTISF